MIFSKTLAWVWVAAYAGFIFYLSSLSHPVPAELTFLEKYHIDWIFHVIEYAFFGWLLMRAMGVTFSGRPVLALAVMAFLIGALYALSDEWHQSFVPNRESSAFDFMADTAGIFCGVRFKLKKGFQRNA